jgi:hypothetical protein
LEIRDTKGADNRVADHLSRMQVRGSDLPIDDYLRDDTLLKVTTASPWYANLVNFMVTGYIPLGEDRKKLIHLSRYHLWDDPYLFKVCANGLLCRCMPLCETRKILELCHSSPYGGHYEAFRTHAKVWQSGFFSPNMYGSANEFVRQCPRCQKHGNINSRDGGATFKCRSLTSWVLTLCQSSLNTSWWQWTTCPNGLKHFPALRLTRRTRRKYSRKSYYLASKFLES